MPVGEGKGPLGTSSAYVAAQLAASYSLSDAAGVSYGRAETPVRHFRGPPRPALHTVDALGRAQIAAQAPAARFSNLLIVGPSAEDLQRSKRCSNQASPPIRFAVRPGAWQAGTRAGQQAPFFLARRGCLCVVRGPHTHGRHSCRWGRPGSGSGKNAPAPLQCCRGGGPQGRPASAGPVHSGRGEPSGVLPCRRRSGGAGRLLCRGGRHPPAAAQPGAGGAVRGAAGPLPLAEGRRRSPGAQGAAGGASSGPCTRCTHKSSALCLALWAAQR